MSKDTSKIGIQSNYIGLPNESQQILRETLSNNFFQDVNSYKSTIGKFKEGFKDFGIVENKKFDWFVDQILYQKYLDSATPIPEILNSTSKEDVMQIWRGSSKDIDESYQNYQKEAVKQFENIKNKTLAEIDKTIQSDPNQKWLKYKSKFDKSGKLKFELSPIDPSTLDDGGFFDQIFDDDLEEQHYMMETFIKTMDNDFSESKSKELRNKNFSALKEIYKERYKKFQEKKSEQQSSIKEKYADIHFQNAKIYDESRPSNLWKGFKPSMMPGWKGIERIVGRLLPDDKRTMPEAGQLGEVLKDNTMLTVDRLMSNLNKDEMKLKWGQYSDKAPLFSPYYNLSLAEMSVEALPNSLYFMGELAVGATAARGIFLGLNKLEKLPKVAKFFDNASKVFTAVNKAKAPIVGKGAGVYWANVASRAGRGYVIGELGAIPRMAYEFHNEMYDKSKPRVAEFLYKILTPGLEGMSETVFILPKFGASNIAKAGEKILGSNIAEMVFGEMAEEELTGVVDDLYNKITTGEMGETSLLGQAIAGDFNLKLQLSTIITSVLQGGGMSAYSHAIKNKYSKELIAKIPEIVDYLQNYSNATGTKVFNSLDDKIKENFSKTDILQSHLMNEEAKQVYYAYTLGSKALEDQFFNEEDYNIADYSNDKIAKSIAVGLEILKSQTYNNNPELFDELNLSDKTLDSVLGMDSNQVSTVANDLRESIKNLNKEKMDLINERLDSVFNLLEIPEKDHQELRSIFTDQILFNAMIPNSIDNVFPEVLSENEAKTEYIKSTLKTMLYDFADKDAKKIINDTQVYVQTVQEQLAKEQEELKGLTDPQEIEDKKSDIKDTEDEIALYEEYKSLIESFAKTEINDPEITKTVIKNHFIGHYRKQMKSAYSENMKKGKYDRAVIQELKGKFLGNEIGDKKFFQSGVQYDSLTSYHILKNVLENFKKERFEGSEMSLDLQNYYTQAVQLLEGLSSLYEFETDYVSNERKKIDEIHKQAYNNYYKSNPEQILFAKLNITLELYKLAKIKKPVSDFLKDMNELSLEELIIKYQNIPHKVLQIYKERIDVLNNIVLERQKTQPKKQQSKVPSKKTETKTSSETRDIYKEDEVTVEYKKNDNLHALYELIDSESINTVTENYDIVGITVYLDKVMLYNSEGEVKPKSPFLVVFPKSKENYNHGLNNKFKLLFKYYENNPLITEILTNYKNSIEGNYKLPKELVEKIKSNPKQKELVEELSYIYRYLAKDIGTSNKRQSYYAIYEGKEYKIKEKKEGKYYEWLSIYSSPLFGKFKSTVNNVIDIGIAGGWFVEILEKSGVFENIGMQYDIFRNLTFLGNLNSKDIDTFEEKIRDQEIDSNAPISPVVTQTPKEDTSTPPQENKASEEPAKERVVKEQRTFQSVTNNVLDLKGSEKYFEVTFYEGEDTGELTILTENFNSAMLNNPSRSLPQEVAEYMNLFPDIITGIKILTKGEVKKIDGQYVITQPVQIEFDNGKPMDPSVRPKLRNVSQNTSNTSSQPQGDTNSDETTQSTAKEEIVSPEPSKQSYSIKKIFNSYFQKKMSKEEVQQRLSNDGFLGETINHTTILKAVLRIQKGYDLVDESKVDIESLTNEEIIAIKVSKNFEDLKGRIWNQEKDSIKEEVEEKEDDDFSSRMTSNLNALLPKDKPLTENYDLVLGLLNEMISLDEIEKKIKPSSDFLTKLRVMFFNMQKFGINEAWTKKQLYALRSLFLMVLKDYDKIVAYDQNDQIYIIYEPEVIKAIQNGTVKLDITNFDIKKFKTANKDFPNIEHHVNTIRETNKLLYTLKYGDASLKTVSVTLPYKSIDERIFDSGKHVKEFVELTRMINNIYNDTLDPLLTYSDKFIDALFAFKEKATEEQKKTVVNWMINEVFNTGYKTQKQYNFLVMGFYFLVDYKESFDDIQGSEEKRLISLFENDSIIYPLENVNTPKEYKEYIKPFLANDEAALAYYDSKIDKIVLFGNWSRNPFSVVHEVLHSMTINTIGDSKEFTEIREFLQDKVNPIYIENNSEMISYLYSDKYYVRQLMSIPYKKVEDETNERSVFDEIIELLSSEIAKDEIQKDNVAQALHNHFKNWLNRPERPSVKGDNDEDKFFMVDPEGTLKKILLGGKEFSGMNEEGMEQKYEPIPKHAMNLRAETFKSALEESLREEAETLSSTIIEIEESIEGDMLLDVVAMNEILKEMSVFLSDINWKLQSPYDFFGNMGIDKFADFFDIKKLEAKKDDPKYDALVNLYNTFQLTLLSTFKKSKVDDTISKTEYKDRVIRDLYAKLSSKENYVNYEIAYEVSTDDERQRQAEESRVELDRIPKLTVKVVKLGINSKNSAGKKLSTLMSIMSIDKSIRVSLEQLFNQLGDLKVSLETRYIRSFFGKHFEDSTESKWGHNIETALGVVKSFSLFVNRTMNMNGGLIYLNKFGDKSIFPVYKLRSKASEEDLKKLLEDENIKVENSTIKTYLYFKIIAPLYYIYRQQGIDYYVKKYGISENEALSYFYEATEIEEFKEGKKVTGKQYADIWSIVTRILVEEIKLGNNPKNLIPVKNEETGKTTILTMLYGRNMIELMKRSTPVAENRHLEISQEKMKSKWDVLEKDIENIEDVMYGNKMPDMVYSKGQLYYKTVFFNTKNLDNLPEEVLGEVLDFFYNKYGTFRFDGADFVVRGKFDDFYAWATGQLNSGVSKNIILHKNLYMKHATHSIPEDSFLGKWMEKNKVAYLIFDLNEKNNVLLNHQNGQVQGSLLKDNEGNSVPYQEQPIGFLKNSMESLMREKRGEEYDKNSIATYYLPINSIHRISEKYNNKTEVKGIQQIFFSSGLSFANKVLTSHPDLIPLVNKYLKMTSLYFNSLLKDDKKWKAELVRYVVNQIDSGSGTLTADLRDIFPELPYMYTKKSLSKILQKETRDFTNDQIFEYLKVFLSNEALMEVVSKFLNPSLSSYAKVEESGRQLTLSIDIGNTSEQRNKEIDESIKKSLIPNEEYYEEHKEKVDEEIKSFKKKAFDKNGFLKRDYCLITREVADAFGLKAGDRVLGTIVPSASLMECKGLIVAGILTEKTTNLNNIILNHEYAQSLGRDYDIDVIQIIKLNHLNVDEYNSLVDSFMEIEKKYIELIANTFKKSGIETDFKEKYITQRGKEAYESLSALDKNILFYFNNDAFVQYQQKFLGEQKSYKEYYHPAEKMVWKLADIYQKDVGRIIVMRTLHTVLSNLGLKFEFTLSGDRIIKVDFSNKDTFWVNHIAQMIGTQHQVDYPKDTSKDSYNNDALTYFTKMLSPQLDYHKLSLADKGVIEKIYNYFVNLTDTFRIPSLNDTKTQSKAEVFYQKIVDYYNIKKTIKSNLKNVSNVQMDLTKIFPYDVLVKSIDYNSLKRILDFIEYNPHQLHLINKILESKFLEEHLTTGMLKMMRSIDLEYLRNNLIPTLKYLLDERNRITDNFSMFQKLGGTFINSDRFSLENIEEYPLFLIGKGMSETLFQDFGILQLFQHPTLEEKTYTSNIAGEVKVPLFLERSASEEVTQEQILLQTTFVNVLKQDYITRMLNDMTDELKKMGEIPETVESQRGMFALEYGIPIDILERLIELNAIDFPSSASRTDCIEMLSDRFAERFPNLNITGTIQKRKKDNESKEAYKFLLLNYFTKDRTQEIRDRFKVIDSVKNKHGFSFGFKNKESYKKFLRKNGENPELSFYLHLYGFKTKTKLSSFDLLKSQVHDQIPLSWYIFDKGFINFEDIFTTMLLMGFRQFGMGTNSQTGDSSVLATQIQSVMGDKFTKVMSIITMLNTYLTGKTEFLSKQDESGEHFSSDDMMLNRIQSVTKKTSFYQQYFSDIAVATFTNIASEYNDVLSTNGLKYTIGGIDYEIRIETREDKVYFKLYKDKLFEEEEQSTIALNGKIHQLIKLPEFWNATNRGKLFNTVKDIIRHKNMSLHDRKKMFNKVFEGFLSELGLRQNGAITTEGQKIIDTAFGLMLGIPERTPTIAHNLYIKGLALNNNLLFSVMSNWAPFVLLKYKLHALRWLGNNLSRMKMLNSIDEGQLKIESKALKARKAKLLQFEKEKHHHPMVFFGQESLIKGISYKNETKGMDEEQLKNSIMELAVEIKNNNLDLIAPEIGELTDNPVRYLSSLAYIDTTVSAQIEETIGNERTRLDRLRRIYVDLKFILQTHEKSKDVPKSLISRVYGRGKLLLALARKYGVLDLTIFDDTQQNKMVYRAYNNKFIKGFYQAEDEELEELKSNHYVMEPNTMNIISNATDPYSKNKSGLRPFGLMEAFWAKVDELNTLMREDLRVIEEKLDNIDTFANIDSKQTELNLIKSRIRSHLKDKIQSSALMLADEFSRTLIIKKRKVVVKNGISNTVFKVETFDEFEKFFDYYFSQSKIEGDLFTREEYMIIAYQALALRKIFDYDLRIAIDRVYSFMDTVKRDFEGTGIYEKQINDLFKKYQILYSRFKPELRSGGINTNRITPKVFNSKDVITHYVDQMISVRWNSINEYLEKYEEWSEKNEDQDREWIDSIIQQGEKLREVDPKDRYEYLQGIMQEEIKKRIGTLEFYVPLFSKIEDNHLTKGYLPFIGMIKTHVFQRLFDMMEKDINTVYYYQFKTKALQTGLPDSHIQAVTNWFSDFINAIDIEKQVTDVVDVRPKDFIHFYFDDPVSGYYIVSGEVIENEDGKIVIERNGEKFTFSHDQVNVNLFNNEEMQTGQVYVTTLPWQKHIERRVQREGFMNNWYLPSSWLYWATMGAKSLYTQLTIGSIFAPVTSMFNFFGGTVSNIVEFNSLKKSLDNLTPDEKDEWAKKLKAFTTFGNMSSSFDYNASEHDLISFSTKTSIFSIQDFKMFWNLYKKTAEYEQTETKINALLEQIKNKNAQLVELDRTDKKTQEANIAKSRKLRLNITNLWRQISRLEGLIEYKFSANDIYNNVSKEDEEQLENEYGAILDEYKTTGKMPFLVKMSGVELSKIYALLVLRKSSNTIRSIIQFPEGHLRHTAALGAWYLAADSGVANEDDLYAWAKRGITLSQMIYNQHARKIGSTGFLNKFTDLLGQYVYVIYLNTLQRIDEMNYQALSVGVRTYIYETLLHQLSRLGYPSIQVMISDANGYKTKTLRQKKEGEPLFENAMAKMIRQLMVTGILSNINGIVSGFTRMANPAILPFYTLIVFLLKWADDDPKNQPMIKDIIYIINLYLQTQFGLGAGLVYNIPINYLTSGNEFGLDDPEGEKISAVVKGITPRAYSKYGEGVFGTLFGAEKKFDNILVTKGDLYDVLNEASRKAGFFSIKSMQWYDDPQYLEIMKKEVGFDNISEAQLLKAIFVPGYSDRKSDDMLIKLKIQDIFKKGFVSPQKREEYENYINDFKFKTITPINQLF